MGRRIDTRAHDLDDVLALDERADTRLLLEALAQGGIGHELREHQLESPRLPCADLLDDVDRAHAPLSERPENTKIAGKYRRGLKVEQIHPSPLVAGLAKSAYVVEATLTEAFVKKEITGRGGAKEWRIPPNPSFSPFLPVSLSMDENRES
jgi:hypothetical protein